MNLDTLIAASMNRPHRNVYGDLGPRCHPCSGLGKVFRLQEGRRVSHATTCRCEGSGLDLDRIERSDRELLWRRLHVLESRLGLERTSRYQFPPIVNSRQSWQELIYGSAVDGTAVANTTSETILFPNVTIPANYMENGRGLRITVGGKWSTTTGTVTHVYRVRYNGVGGNVLCATGTVTLLVSITNGYFEFTVNVMTRANGTLGNLLADGVAKAFAATAPTIGSATGAPAVAPMTVGGQTGPADSVDVDLTVDWPLAVTIQHGAQSASNTATGMHYLLESMN